MRHKSLLAIASELAYTKLEPALTHPAWHRGVSAFDSLNTKQWQTVLLAMEKRHCLAGEVVVAQVSTCSGIMLLQAWATLPAC